MSQFRVMTALRPSVSDAVTECSPSPKGRPVGPRAQRSNGISSVSLISRLLLGSILQSNIPYCHLIKQTIVKEPGKITRAATKLGSISARSKTGE